MCVCVCVGGRKKGGRKGERRVVAGHSEAQKDVCADTHRPLGRLLRQQTDITSQAQHRFDCRLIDRLSAGWLFLNWQISAT